MWSMSSKSIWSIDRKNAEIHFNILKQYDKKSRNLGDYMSQNERVYFE